jgi:DNA-binding beta-propeller fold protein YncE
MDSQRLLGLALAALVGAACPAAAAASSVYAVNNGGANISQYDVGPAGVLTAKTPTAVNTGSDPYAIALTPDGRSAYVTAYEDDKVWQYDVGPGGGLTPKSPATVDTAVEPSTVAVSPDGRSLYVGTVGTFISQYDIGAGGKLSPKSPANVSAGTNIQGIAVSPDGRSVYVVNQNDPGTVSQFDVGASGKLSPKSTPTVAAGKNPDAISLTPDGTSAYVANYTDSNVTQYDVGPAGLLTPKTPPTVPTSSGPEGITVAPDGRSAYTPDGGGGTSVSQYNIGAGGLLVPKAPASVTGFSTPIHVALSPDSQSAYVSNFIPAGFLSQFDTSLGGALTPKNPSTIPAGTYPYTGVVVSPDQGPVAQFSATVAPPGSATRLDGSGSSDSDDVVARYDWDFGDGSSAPNGGPKPTHVYKSTGTYTVTLTVTDAIGCSTAMVFTGQTASCNGGAVARSAQQIAVKDTKPPKLTRLSLSPTAFAAAKSGPSAAKSVGTTVKYRVSEAAVTKFTVERPARGVKRGKRCVKPGKGKTKGHRCTRYVRLRGSFSHKDKVGANKLRFRGRLSRHSLHPGHYRLVATPKDAAGNTGKHVRRKFRIVR